MDPGAGGREALKIVTSNVWPTSRFGLCHAARPSWGHARTSAPCGPATLSPTTDFYVSMHGQYSLPRFPYVALVRPTLLSCKISWRGCLTGIGYASGGESRSGSACARLICTRAQVQARSRLRSALTRLQVHPAELANNAITKVYCPPRTSLDYRHLQLVCSVAAPSTIHCARLRPRLRTTSRPLLIGADIYGGVGYPRIPLIVLECLKSSRLSRTTSSMMRRSPRPVGGRSASVPHSRQKRSGAVRTKGESFRRPRRAGVCRAPMAVA